MHHHRSRKVSTSLPFTLTLPTPLLTPLTLYPSSCNSGIGLETSLVFANEGAHVVAADINYEAAQRTVDLIAKHCEGAKKALAVKADVSKEEEVKEMVAKAVQEFGRLDVVL